ncbi:DUF4197 domain-containing protein [Psychroflexus montanilacus]|uniref:DUF4197 domain-containing protein n=1 Tax=Psychroflexus montanilacus TaxID=2873598 RepID=UPI001CCA58D8|nr:DUF4197 domain-containing protein [Psychroflexus montanilacus]MBZ9652008.1 DUF4197 domain-containing protein [Psychroflexus montanilacus]
MKQAISFVLLIIFFTSCAELEQISKEIAKSGNLTEQQIANGLQEALSKGVDQQVSKLTKEDGFYNNSLVKIGLPQELSSIESTLRSLGLNNLTDQGIKALNTTAQQAVKEATPIVKKAIQDMTFEEAKNILLGNNIAATTYLREKTQEELYQKFEPIVKDNFQKVGAEQIWQNVIQKYNQIPLTENVNPDLTDYVTNEALKGVFKMIELEEVQIRNDAKERSTELLRRVFALQD